MPAGQEKTKGLMGTISPGFLRKGDQSRSDRAVFECEEHGVFVPTWTLL